MSWTWLKSRQNTKTMKLSSSFLLCNIFMITYLYEFLICIAKSVKEAINPQHAKNWLHKEMSFRTPKTGGDNTYSSIQSRWWTASEPPPRPQRANAAFTVGLCHSEPVIQRAEIIWSSDYYGSPVPFNVSFQAYDMWLSACSLIASNNKRAALPGG